MCAKKGVQLMEMDANGRQSSTCRLRVVYVSFTSRLRVVYVFYGEKAGKKVIGMT